MFWACHNYLKKCASTLNDVMDEYRIVNNSLLSPKNGKKSSILQISHWQKQKINKQTQTIEYTFLNLKLK